MKKITVGVLGAGRIGRVHMSVMNNNPSVEIKTVVDTFMNPSLEKELKRFGVSHTSKEPDDIFHDRAIDAVFICAPTETHYEFSVKAIRSGKHVFCEKPVDMDLQRIKDIKKKLNSSPNIYQVGFNRRFDHNFMAAQKSVQSRKIGVAQMIRITSRDPAPPSISYIKTSGGLFMDMMIHDFDMARFQTGSEVEEVYTLAAVLVDENIGKVGDVDSAVVSLKFQNGMIGVIENCRQAKYGYDQRLEVLGDRGMVRIENDCTSTLVTSNSGGITREKPLHFFIDRYKDAYDLEQQNFFEAILKNRKESPCGIDDGIESVRLAYAALKSLKEHRPVKITEIR